jgi:hypothetical protein
VRDIDVPDGAVEEHDDRVVAVKKHERTATLEHHGAGAGVNSPTSADRGRVELVVSRRVGSQGRCLNRRG